MRKPRYSGVGAMEEDAGRQADDTVSLRLRHPSYYPGNTAWLRVESIGQGEYTYWFEQKKRGRKLTRDEAQAIIDKEWEPRP